MADEQGVAHPSDCIYFRYDEGRWDCYRCSHGESQDGVCVPLVKPKGCPYGGPFFAMITAGCRCPECNSYGLFSLSEEEQVGGPAGVRYRCEECLTCFDAEMKPMIS